MRLIDADELKKSLNFVYDCDYIGSKSKEGIVSDIILAIDNAPTIKTFTLADIEEQYRKGLEKGLSEWETERPQGKWIEHWDKGYVECPFCHKQITGGDLNFCCKCGADMRGEKNDNRNS